MGKEVWKVGVFAVLDNTGCLVSKPSLFNG